MNNRALMRKEEENFLRAAQRVLLQGGFPNPERTGCPSRALLKAIAYREVKPREAHGLDRARRYVLSLL